MTGRKAISDAERELLALPCRLGGLGITIPNRVATAQYQSSTEITALIVHQIIQKKYEYNEQVQAEQKQMNQKPKIERDGSKSKKPTTYNCQNT